MWQSGQINQVQQANAFANCDSQLNRRSVIGIWDIVANGRNERAEKAGAL